MQLIAGIDLGGTAVNYTFVDRDGALADRRPVRASGAVQGGPGHLPAADCRRPRHRGGEGRHRPRRRRRRRARHAGAGERHGRAERARVDQLRPSRTGPASTCREALAHKLGKPVTLPQRRQRRRALGPLHHLRRQAHRDLRSRRSSARASAAASSSTATSSRAAHGFGGELGHVLIPYQSIKGIEGLVPAVQLRPHGRSGVALLAHRHREDAAAVLPDAATRTTSWRRWTPCRRPSASAGWPSAATRCAATSSASQAHALGLFFDEMINTFDPDALIVGGGAIETDARVPGNGSSTRSAPACPRSAKSRPTSRSTSCPTAIPPAPAAPPSRPSTTPRRSDRLMR